MKKAAHYQSLEFDRVKEVVAGLAGKRSAPLNILDFGCGRGKYLDCFAAMGCRVTGVDSNSSYVADAERRGFAAHMPKEFFSTTPPTYDVIFLSHLVEHLAPTDAADLIPRLCTLLASQGSLVIVTPTFGERFYYDFTHVRPYLPQSIRHAFGQTGSPISFGEMNMLELVDIYFFKDPYRTRLWRSFYVGNGPAKMCTRMLNAAFDMVWHISRGRCGVVSSWLGVYRLKVQS